MTDFGPFDGHVWLNCAHQGPLPRAAVEAAEVALAEKRQPFRLTEETFEETPRRLKRALGRLVDVPPDEIILGNSTAYGLNLLVQGLPLRAGDEVLLVDGDFPSTVVTWLPLRKRGIEVRLARPPEWPPSPAWVDEQIGPRTRVFCCSWVFSFFGSAIDLDAVASACRDRDVLFVLNASQAIGARPLSLDAAPVDALVSCGFKWQCGPYGTGFAWIRPDVLESLTYEQAYWLGRGASRSSTYEIRDDGGAAAFDVFGTANFLSFRAWTASVELLLDVGIEQIAAHDDRLVERVAAGLVDLGFTLVSPRSGGSRSTLVLFSHRDPARNGAIKAALDESGVHVAERDGKLRISPHLYNTEEEVDRALDVLRDLA
ncbi:MAG TPA: aminotransferase class V-fold PLP-dependent enzyme [Actinomycetota bacterium]|nr:aminotransferase class V-fold PLP-dependent enzyme [Actinomycetota bacterium]